MVECVFNFAGPRGSLPPPPDGLGGGEAWAAIRGQVRPTDGSAWLRLEEGGIGNISRQDFSADATKTIFLQKI